MPMTTRGRLKVKSLFLRINNCDSGANSTDSSINSSRSKSTDSNASSDNSCSGVHGRNR